MLERVRALRSMLRADWQQPAQLRSHQSSLLRKLLRLASRDVPFYRDLYTSAGVDPASVRSAADLQCLPLVDKRTLRAAGDAAFRAPIGHGAAKIIETSGSTGEPYRFPIDRQHDQWRKAQYLRPYLTNGRRLQDHVLRLTAFPRRQTALFARLGLLRETQMNCAAAAGEILDRWRTSGANILQGYPSSLRGLALRCLEQGATLAPAPRAVFTDSELLTPDTRALLASAFGVPVVDVFGTYETDNIAYQCEIGGGYHVTLDTVVLEIVRDGAVVPDGQEGELVVTVLHNHRSPFIRYNLHDVGRYATTPCACGRGLPLLELLKGRSDSLLRFEDGTERSAMSALGALDGFGRSVRLYQLRQHAANRFTLLVEPTSAFDDSVIAALQSCLAAQLPGASVRIELTASISRAASGKLLAFTRDPESGLA
jgi:phenylacetate-coenzyme A ligase PaaK-like adenylate-forming protein